MENRETPLPMPATGMTVKLFRAMSKASGENIRFMYSMAFAGGTAAEAETRTAQRQHAYHVAAHRRPESMGKDL